MLLKLRAELLGGHVHVQVFAGPQPGALGLTGTLVMRPEEYRDLGGLLLTGARWSQDRERVKVEIVGRQPDAPLPSEARS